MQRRMLSAIAATGLGLALAVSIAPQSLAAEGTTGTTARTGAAQEQDPGAVEPDPCRTIDFDEAQALPLYSIDPVPEEDPASAEDLWPTNRYRLTVKGMKSASNVSVRLVPLVYVRQPTFWGIVVTGCSSGIGLPVLTPYTATYDFTAPLGTCGIEVIGATKSKRFDLVGCKPIPLAGTRWRLESSSLDVPIPAGTMVTANFSETTMSGSTSCNRYQAGYRTDENGAFELGPIAVTERACDSLTGRIEADFLRRLAAVDQVQATESQVRLLADGKVLLHFIPVRSTLRTGPVPS